MSTNFAITLVPNEWSLRPKAFSVDERVWALAVKLVDKGGFRPNFVGGVDKRDVEPLARHLGQALEQEGLPDSDRQALGALVRFLTGGAGTRGLTLKRGWKKWNQP